MSSFRERNVYNDKRSRKRSVSKLSASANNLYVLHLNKMEEFATEKDQLATKTAQMNQLATRLSVLKKKQLKSIDDLSELSRLEEQYKTLKKEVHNLESNSNVLEYFFKAGDVLTEYSELDSEPTKSCISIADFFRMGTLSATKPPTTKRSSNNKKELLEKYLELTNPMHVFPTKTTLASSCPYCNAEMHQQRQVGTRVCCSCGASVNMLVDSEGQRNSTKTTHVENVRYSVYQRKNHFKEWLSQLQARESTEIPADVLDMILVELNKIRFTNLADLNPTVIRKILKKLNLSRYYENTFHIIYRLNGLQPPTLSRETEEKLVYYFKQIEEPFRLYKKQGRKNILRYSYIIFKLCELLELDDLLPCFKLLKNRTKLIEQDTVWQAICKHLGWQYIPSV